LINRADVTLFPVDCVSHDAAATVKRLCGQSNIRWRSEEVLVVRSM
jgi:hypothetical protein